MHVHGKVELLVQSTPSLRDEEDRVLRARKREIKREELLEQELQGKDTCFCYTDRPEIQIIARLWLARTLPNSASYKGEGNLKSADRQGGRGESSLAFLKKEELC